VSCLMLASVQAVARSERAIMCFIWTPLICDFVSSYFVTNFTLLNKFITSCAFLITFGARYHYNLATVFPFMDVKQMDNPLSNSFNHVASP
jgi:hypothetical protein